MATPPNTIPPIVGIPALDPSGILPPFVGSGTPTPASMSPFAATLLQTAQRFCGSPARVTIFRGFLEYRRTLSTLGFVQGFQWLSGSFMEDIERLEGRDPRDVDLVTFCTPPAHCLTPADIRAIVVANSDVFLPPRAKTRFHCDPYFVNLQELPVSTVTQTRYWFGLFSHRRGGMWKGLVQVPLAISQDDQDTETFLNGLPNP
jgi:hypothetical protein